MGKKIFNGSILYFIGMTLVLIGFILPICGSGKFATNGFDCINFEKITPSGIGFILVFVGACYGICCSLFSKFSSKTSKLIALAITLAGGVIVTLVITGVITEGTVHKVFKNFIKKSWIKNVGLGFYVIIVGWTVAICGWVTEK